METEKKNNLTLVVLENAVEVFAIHLLKGATQRAAYIEAFPVKCKGRGKNAIEAAASRWVKENKNAVKKKMDAISTSNEELSRDALVGGILHDIQDLDKKAVPQIAPVVVGKKKGEDGLYYPVVEDAQVNSMGEMISARTAAMKGRQDLLKTLHGDNSENKTPPLRLPVNTVGAILLSDDINRHHKKPIEAEFKRVDDDDDDKECSKTTPPPK